MHHDVCNVAVVAVGVGDLAAQEDSGVRVHGCLVGWHGLVQLPHDDGFGVVEQVLADTGNVLDYLDAEILQLLLGSQTGQQHQTRSVDCTGAEDCLVLRVQHVLGAVLESDVDSSDLVAGNVDLADPSVGEDSQVGPLLSTAQDGVDVCNTGAAPASVVGVVRDGEETNALLQRSSLLDLLVEVVDNGDVHGSRG